MALRLPHDVVQLTILEFERLWGNQPSGDGRPIFATSQPIGTFARTILASADATLDRYGESGYLEQWIREPFPVENVESLRLALALHPRH